ncbi:hypothetical protein F2P56_030036 [Juglans regia]|uniref:Uncharacterized protein n=1 Tax=Juglans regia TaxID=51240 RepID=A0A833U3M6_JUGRE|nr:hypothetical protein F2P56_030036 [Juglans regia]
MWNQCFKTHRISLSNLIQNFGPHRNAPHRLHQAPPSAFYASPFPPRAIPLEVEEGDSIPQSASVEDGTSLPSKPPPSLPQCLDGSLRPTLKFCLYSTKDQGAPPPHHRTPTPRTGNCRVDSEPGKPLFLSQTPWSFSPCFLLLFLRSFYPPPFIVVGFYFT